MGYLLDTDVCIELLHGNQVAVKKLRSVPSGQVVLCSIVEAELLTGAIKSSEASALGNTRAFISTFPVLTFSSASASRYATIRADLERRGLPIGPNDLLIAAIAAEHGLMLATANVREFSRVAGLVVEDWTKP